MIKQAVFLDMDSIDIGDLDLRRLKQAVPDMIIRKYTTADEVTEALAYADCVISNKVNIGREQMQGSELKLICVAATGTNNVDLDAARELGIVVCNVRAYATASVVQHVFACLLSLMTRLPEVSQAAINGEWSESPYFALLKYPVTELQGKTLGIVGYGELGRSVAAVAKAFGMRVIIARRNTADRRDDRIPLHDMLPQLDVLSLHCPLTPETENLITMKEIQSMKPSAILINTARGGIVNEADLLLALQQKRIAGAAIDVLTTEPPAKDHPLLQQELKNLIVTPHVAWASRESRQRLLDQLADNIVAFNQGQPQNRV
ncbi:MAG: D-2-hydroxyacid dehydrogenase [Gammaproteobacteria bacterium]|nr:D-2-hydroxyacid dehydrogenase [Gammaproteobacteria bacterium]